MINNGFMFRRKNMFDLLHEAPEDGADTGNNAGGAEAPAADTGAEDAGTDDTATDDAGGDDDTTDMGNDDDFDVDTNIDDGADGDPDSTEGDDTGGGSDLGGDSGTSLDGGGEEEVNPKNTDIFSTLSKEEQAIKIGELKKKFNELYIYISDMYGKINDISPDEDNLEAIYRVTSGLYSTKEYVGDYIKTIFPMKSYIENDIAYNRFLTIIQSITQVINTLASEIEGKIQKDSKK